MLSEYVRRWWVLALRGVVAVLFGVAAIIWPVIALQVFVLLFGAFALADGLLSIVISLVIRREVSHWWVWLLEGLAGIVTGVLVFLWPAITTAVLIALIAVWGLVTGIIEIAAAIHLRKIIAGEWMLMLDGILSILLGAFLVIFPLIGVQVLVYLIGIYAIVFGILLIVLAFQIRKLGKTLEIHTVEIS
ncbi:MAG TPA: HdeD family acid-resistance protein [Anaerolineales bacterium]|nr:HdeD family acid-resistance protein [Anaerolineales bacterium]